MIDDRPTVERLNDARHYANEVRQIVSAAKSELDARDYLAIRYCLVVIGETLDRVPEDLLAHEPTIPWRRIIGLRHRLVHGYWLIDQDIITEIARNEAEPLIVALDRLLR